MSALGRESEECRRLLQVPPEYQAAVNNLQTSLPTLLQQLNPGVDPDATLRNLTANLGNPACWGGGFDFARCCDLQVSTTGDNSCWTGPGFDYDGCCLYGAPAVPQADAGAACSALGPAGGDTQMNLGIMWLKLVEMDDVDPYSHLWQMLFIGLALRLASYVRTTRRQPHPNTR